MVQIINIGQFYTKDCRVSCRNISLLSVVFSDDNKQVNRVVQLRTRTRITGWKINSSLKKNGEKRCRTKAVNNSIRVTMQYIYNYKYYSRFGVDRIRSMICNWLKKHLFVLCYLLFISSLRSTLIMLLLFCFDRNLLSTSKLLAYCYLVVESDFLIELTIHFNFIMIIEFQNR